MDLQQDGRLDWIDLAQDMYQPEIDVGYSPPSSVEVKNEWSFTSSPLLAFIARKAQIYFFALLYLKGNIR